MAAGYGIVKNHDGWISADSELGKRSMVCIYLTAIGLQVKKEGKPRIEPIKGYRTILIIEDEKMIMDVSRELFTQTLLIPPWDRRDSGSLL